jgi:hypothetical protein
MSPTVLTTINWKSFARSLPKNFCQVIYTLPTSFDANMIAIDNTAIDTTATANSIFTTTIAIITTTASAITNIISRTELSELFELPELIQLFELIELTEVSELSDLILRDISCPHNECIKHVHPFETEFTLQAYTAIHDEGEILPFHHGYIDDDDVLKQGEPPPREPLPGEPGELRKYLPGEGMPFELPKEPHDGLPDCQFDATQQSESASNIAVETARRKKSDFLDWTVTYLNPLQAVLLYAMQLNGTELYLIQSCTCIKKLDSKQLLCDMDSDSIIHDIELVTETETILRILWLHCKLKSEEELPENLILNIELDFDWTIVDHMSALNHILIDFQNNQLEPCKTQQFTIMDEEFKEPFEKKSVMESMDCRSFNAYTVEPLLRKLCHWKPAQMLLSHLKADFALKYMTLEEGDLELECHIDIAGDSQTEQSAFRMHCLLHGTSIFDLKGTDWEHNKHICTWEMITDFLTTMRKYKQEFRENNIGLLKGSVENGDRLVDDVSKPEEETTSHLTLDTPMYVTTSMQRHMQTVQHERETLCVEV